MKKLLAAAFTSLMLSAGANAVEIITNGNFETGDLTGWSTSNLGTTGTCPSATRDWNVAATSSTGCSTVANPIGNFAAYAMNDGPANTNLSLFQTLDLTNVAGGLLSFEWTATSSHDPARTFSVFLGGSEIFGMSSQANPSAWTNVSLDISSELLALSGSSALLEFRNYIPSTWTGPAGIGLDNVSIDATIASVAGPSTLALIGLGLAGLGLSRKRKEV